MEKGVEAEIASFENECSVDINWISKEILQLSNYVEHWRLILWDKAFQVYFNNKGDLKFVKDLDLTEFVEAPSQSNVLLKNKFSNCHFVHIVFVSFLFQHHFLIPCSSFSRYIHRELVVKNALPPWYLSIFLFDWVDVNSNLCVYTAM